MIRSVGGDAADVLLISRGGSPEAAERIVTMLRERFSRLRYLIPSDAFSAATLMCFSGDTVLMTASGTLGPIDPQFGAVPVRAILRGFDAVQEKIKSEGPAALTGYMPLLAKYDLHMIEMCRTAEALSIELAESWLARYMLKCERSDPRVSKIAKHFSDFDQQKSHARSIARAESTEVGVDVTAVEDVPGLSDLVHGLAAQYDWFYGKSDLFKSFETVHGVAWGRSLIQRVVQVPGPMQPAAPRGGADPLGPVPQ